MGLNGSSIFIFNKQKFQLRSIHPKQGALFVLIGNSNRSDFFITLSKSLSISDEFFLGIYHTDYQDILIRHPLKHSLDYMEIYQDQKILLKSQKKITILNLENMTILSKKSIQNESVSQCGLLSDESILIVGD